MRQEQSKTVVVIDDDPDQVELTVLLLEAAGHRAIGDTDGTKAVPLIVDSGAEVVILDFQLAGMTGADVGRAIRDDPRTSDVRIVVVSGTPLNEIRRSYTGYDRFLAKPVNHGALVKAIH